MSRSLCLRPSACLAAVACFSFGIRQEYESSTKVGISNKGSVQVGSATDHWVSVSAVNVSTARRPAESQHPQLNELNGTFGKPKPIAMLLNETCGPISTYNCLQFCPGKNIKRSVLWARVADAKGEDAYSGNATTSSELAFVLKSIGFDPVITVGGRGRDMKSKIKEDLAECNFQTMFLWLVPLPIAKKEKSTANKEELPADEFPPGHWVAVMMNHLKKDTEWVVYDPWLDSIRDPHQKISNKRLFELYGPNDDPDDDPAKLNPDNFAKKPLKPVKVSNYIIKKTNGLKGNLGNVMQTIQIHCETRPKPASCCVFL